jgi:diacylglycerol O-acyltransferase / wax synthase
MSKLKPIDTAFLLLESSSRQMHMTAYQLFEPPKVGAKGFVGRLLETFRNSEVTEPFNQRLKWLGKGLASWEKVEPDLNYHVRHLAVPAPGRLDQFYELVSFLNTPLLDRALPLWECYVIEGIEGGRFAIMIKVHHALIDGGGALKLFRNAMSDSPKDREIRAVWMPGEQPRVKRKRSRVSESQISKLRDSLGGLSSGLRGTAGELASMGAQSLGLSPKKTALPFGASNLRFNRVAQSSARRYANCELPLADAKAIASATGTTVNDVVTAVIDHALHQYLKDGGEVTEEALVALMAISFRSDDQKASGNQVSVELVAMGEPGAAIRERLDQVHLSTSQVKAKSRRLPTSVRQFYSLFLFGSASLSDLSATMEGTPSANLVISNMVGPQEQLYMGGAHMVAFQGLPIVPPGGGLNVTFASISGNICLAVGATPEAVDDPYRLVQFILADFATLREATLGAAAKAGSRSGGRKKAAGKSRNTAGAAKKASGRKRPPARKKRAPGSAG